MLPESDKRHLSELYNSNLLIAITRTANNRYKSATLSLHMYRFNARPVMECFSTLVSALGLVIQIMVAEADCTLRTSVGISCTD